MWLECLNKLCKSQISKERISLWDRLHKINLCTATVAKTTLKDTIWEKIFAMHITQRMNQTHAHGGCTDLHTTNHRHSNSLGGTLGEKVWIYS